VVEVLSPGTEKYDRGGKFDNYRTLPSLREYVIVSQDEPFVQAWYLHDPRKQPLENKRGEGLGGLHSIYFHRLHLEFERHLTPGEIWGKLT
jgi:Uma2 family endonuclease